MASEPRLPFDAPATPMEAMVSRDQAARAAAVDPSRNVVLEASAGTGKTQVLVTRYLNLLRAGVDPAHILAITFTRKAAAEMRERIVRDLRAAAKLSAADAERWRTLRDRVGDIAISTIDAFCFALLREFPLEADLDPGFEVADESMMPRFVEEALDGTLRVARRMASRDADVALLMARLGERSVRRGLAALVDRRLVAGPAIRRYLASTPGPTPPEALGRLAARVRDALASIDGGLERFIADGPAENDAYELLSADLRAAGEGTSHATRAVLDRVAHYFVNDKGEARSRPPGEFLKGQCRSAAAWTGHKRAVAAASQGVAAAVHAFESDLNVVLVRAVGTLFRVARWRYGRALEAQAAVDFPEALARALRLLRRMDEFAQSRYRLESRYHHVLVDEFQDTNSAQWQLVARLIESWGEGMGLAHEGPVAPSIFVVGDRKQSIYAFRDADVRMMRRARRYISALRPGGRVRRSIARSFRAAPELLAFVNDLFSSMDTSVRRPDAFRFSSRDRFPVATERPDAGRIGLIAAADLPAAASAVADEVGRLLRDGVVRDRQTGLSRNARPGDVAILFRSRESHRQIEEALESRGIPTYVYKGLGFFDADEVKDLVALLRYLGQPGSPLRAAALLRSRLVRVSDRAVLLLGAHPEAVLAGRARLPDGLPVEDRAVLGRLRASLATWLPLVDRVPPAEVLDRVLADSAYAFELDRVRLVQSRENLKKVRAIARRLQNRGYATMARVARHLDRLSAGDESNAVVDALDAVNLMTVHAAKGLEFPFVFVTNLTRGTGGRDEPVVLVPAGPGGRPLVSVDGGLPEAGASLRDRDLEETKRLLYVAVTRARDGLWLSAVMRNARYRATPGALGEVVPASLKEAFATAAAGADVVEWRAESGGVHALGVARAAPCPATGGAEPDEPAAAPGVAAAPSDFLPLPDASGVPRIGAAAWAIAACAGEEDEGPSPLTGAPGADPALVGTTVHHLFEIGRDGSGADESWLTLRARAFLAGRAADAADAGDAARAAVEAYLRLRGRPEISRVLDGATCQHEVPFSLRLPSTGGAAGSMVVVRGSIDCVATAPDGSMTVVELKTGRPRRWHRTQLDVYVRAVRSLFPGVPVEGRLVYAESPDAAKPGA